MNMTMSQIFLFKWNAVIAVNRKSNPRHFGGIFAERITAHKPRSICIIGGVFLFLSGGECEK